MNVLKGDMKASKRRINSFSEVQDLNIEVEIASVCGISSDAPIVEDGKDVTQAVSTSDHERPNELTGAARPYRAASSDQRERG